MHVTVVGVATTERCGQVAWDLQERDERDPLIYGQKEERDRKDRRNSSRSLSFPPSSLSCQRGTANVLCQTTSTSKQCVKYQRPDIPFTFTSHSFLLFLVPFSPISPTDPIARPFTFRSFFFSTTWAEFTQSQPLCGQTASVLLITAATTADKE